MTLPLVLAGPIVRRVEPRSASIWIALSEPAPVTVLVWHLMQEATATPGVVKMGDAPWATKTVTPITIGERFHVALVTVTNEAPDLPPMPPGTIHAYDVQIDSPTLGLQDLRSLGFLQDEPGDATIDDTPPRLALGYGKDVLPSFVTPPGSLDELAVAHGSCRNTLGGGHDAMMYLDAVIGASLGVAKDRPQQLFLTGDQIYADEVSLLLLRNLNDLGHELFGRHETVPIDIPGLGLTDVAADLTQIPVERRTRLLRQAAHFTSGSTANHLISFAEYCAMYLSAWSPQVWSALPTPDDVYVEETSIASDLLTPHETCAIDRLNKKGRLTDDLAADPVGVWKKESSVGEHSRFETHLKHTSVYREGVPHAARLLANVSTYMIFDDHEVTDDWNLTREWVELVTGAPLGAAVLRNGLMAYALFQGWGNDPKKFASGASARLLDRIANVMSGPAAGPATDVATEIDTLLGLGGAASRIDWHYTVDGAVHRVVVLDTRTHRTFAGRISPPDLLGGTKQIPKGPLAGGLEALFVVSAVPVLGPLLIDSIGQPAMIMATDFSTHVLRGRSDKDDPCAEEPVLGLEEFDAESWARNEDALERLLAHLAGYGSVVLLSGDVHYAMTFALDYWTKSAADAATSRIVQLTSSPMRNVFKEMIENLLRTTALGQRLQSIGLPAVRFAWKDAAEPNLALPAGSSVRPGIRVRMNHDPVLVPGNGWPTGTTVKADPDWRWRLDLVRDTRTLRPGSLDPPQTIGPDVARDVDGHLKLAGRHAIATQQHFDHVRQMVFPNNIGIVRLPLGSDGSRMVRHEIISEDPTDPRRTTPDGPTTVHETSLEPLVEPPPGLVVEGGDDSG